MQKQDDQLELTYSNYVRTQDVTALWMHYLDDNKTAGEKSIRQLHKNVASNIEQVLDAIPHKAPTIRPPTSQARRTRHAEHCWRSRDEL